MKKLSTVIFFVLGFYFVSAQDTLTILQYNLLNYGNNTGYCNSNNNNVNNKDNYIKTITHYIKPDIFTVNEMSSSPSMQQRLLDNTLNTGWINYYKKANFIKVANSYLVNMLYYNSKKLRIYSHVIAQSYIRDIDIYTLYYYSNDLEQGDTAFITCIVTHLKAGSGTANRNKRKIMAQNLMDYLSNHHFTNLMLSGDFNVYSDEEPAITQFMYNNNQTIRFNDPVNRMGNWHNNTNFSDVQTQSTHSESNGCPSYGGMDDRFDFILISNDIKNQIHDVSYIPGSFHPVGQDGKHFNKSINDYPPNISVPADVLNALYNNSDHLPVTLKLKVDKTLGISEWKNTAFSEINFTNPVRNNLILRIKAAKYTLLKIQLISLTGKVLLSREQNIRNESSTLSIPLEKFAKGLYILRFSDGNNNIVVKKLVKE